MNSIQDTIKKILALKDLAPSVHVNRLFSELVEYVTQFDNSVHVPISQLDACTLPHVCSLAEYKLEVYWANRIISGESHVEDFVYYQNYVDLTRVEWSALKSCDVHHDHHLLFVGSGPLPMTAIVLATHHGIGSTLVDSDPEAVRLSKEVIKKLQLEDKIQVIHADAMTFDRYNEFNTIFIAALVGGSSRQKTSIFDKIKSTLRAHTHIITRSSWGKRKLLYTPLPTRVYKMFTPILEIVPYNNIVNSVVILKHDHE